MDFLLRARAVLAHVTYKDWQIALMQNERGLPYLQVRFTASDSTTGAEAQWSGRKWQLSSHMTDSEIVGTALKAVLTAEEHEAREQFLYRGRAVFGPRLDVDRLWELAGDDGALDVRKAA